MKKHFMRRTLLKSLGAAPLAGGVARAQPSYPDRPIRVVVAYAPGGGSDITARIATQFLSPELGQPMPVESRPGANSAIGAEYIARSRPDGYTLFVSGSSTLTQLPFLSRRLTFSSSDFAPISQLCRFPMACAVASSVDGTFTEILARISSRPADFMYGHTGIGSTGHLIGEGIFMRQGLRITSVPYRGASETMTAMISGQIPLTFEAVPAMMAYHRDARIRIVAVTSPERWPSLPDVPTFKELGYTDVAVYGWFSMVAPASTPAPIIARLNLSVSKIITQPRYRELIESTGGQVVYNTPEEFAEIIRTEADKWRAIVEALGITMD
jgi:tripartite-type tricarboxylate transporter receptor subunit TctC